MTEILPGNGLRSSLAADITAGATSLRIATADATKWPTGGEYRAVICQDPANGPYELVYVTGGQGTDTLTVTRAVESYNGDQTARAWSTGASISAVITQNSLKNAAGLTFPLAAPDGSAAAPSYAFASNPATGIYSNGTALGISTGGTFRAFFGASISFNAPLQFSSDNTYDIGANSSARPRNLYVASSAVISGDLTAGSMSVGGTLNVYGGPSTFMFGANMSSGAWTGNGSVPPGGTTGQVLSKSSATDYNLAWITVSGGITLPLAQNLTFSPDNTYDIGASGASRPRTMYLGTNLNVSGAAAFGTTTTASIALYVNNTVTPATSHGIYCFPVFASTVTTLGEAFAAKYQNAFASFTTANAYAMHVYAPTVGQGSWGNATNLYGLQIENQGVSGVTNAYGVYIANQSGAATTNIGLYNLGTSRFDGPIATSSAPSATTALLVQPSSSLSGASQYGIQTNVFITNAVTSAYGVYSSVGFNAALTASSIACFWAAAPSFSAGGSVTNQYGLYVASMGGNTTVTNAYGVFIANQTGASGNNLEPCTTLVLTQPVPRQRRYRRSPRDVLGPDLPASACGC